MKYKIDSLICTPLTNTLLYYIALLLHTDVNEVALGKREVIAEIRSLLILNGMGPVHKVHTW